ncbi:MAG: M15 family metallopeptidase [Calditrichia bacterium]|nr:M15 family metallopeptidase [Calditrichia bacterium]
MASRKISDLVEELQQNADQVLIYCDQRGVDILIYCTYRSPQEQARLYRQSRTGAQIRKKVDSLRNRGFAELAEILVQIGPQEGKLGAHVTFAGPGESWHNFRRAFDAVPLVGGKAMWEKSIPIGRYTVQQSEIPVWNGQEIGQNSRNFPMPSWPRVEIL